MVNTKVILSNETVLAFSLFAVPLGNIPDVKSQAAFISTASTIHRREQAGWGRHSHEPSVPVAAEILLILAMCSIICKNAVADELVAIPEYVHAVMQSARSITTKGMVWTSEKGGRELNGRGRCI